MTTEIIEKIVEETKIVELDIQDLAPIALTVGVAGILIAYTLQIQGDVQGDMTAGSAEYNATADSIEATGKLSAKLPLVVTIIMAALVIGILVRNLMIR
jgi:hypothetical protein